MHRASASALQHHAPPSLGPISCTRKYSARLTSRRPNRSQVAPLRCREARRTPPRTPRARFRPPRALFASPAEHRHRKINAKHIINPPARASSNIPVLMRTARPPACAAGSGLIDGHGWLRARGRVGRRVNFRRGRRRWTLALPIWWSPCASSGPRPTPRCIFRELHTNCTPYTRARIAICGVYILVFRGRRGTPERCKRTARASQGAE